MPFLSKLVTWVSLVGLLFLAFVISGAMAPREQMGVVINSVFLGFLAVFLWYFVISRVQMRHVNALHQHARTKTVPVTFHFSPERFQIDSANSQSTYDWSAIDEVVKLSTGTGLRVGVWVFPVADADLPDGMTGEAFRAQLESWRQAA